MRRYAIYARLGAGAMLMICWGLFGSPLSGVAFLLALTALSAARYRLAAYRWLNAAEAVVCAGYAFVWLPALLGLWLPVIGIFEDMWRVWESELLRRGIEDRGERLKLEASRETASKEMRSAARLAEMAERARIAQDIHDNVGHEITGALIALQAAVKLYEKRDERAGELLRQCTRRLEDASECLRETVHNLKPAKVTGVETLEELCAGFSFCPADFSEAGDLGGFAHWELLAANLKEALTNVSRHSGASRVTVRIDGNSGFVRMTVKDNGHTAGNCDMGLGLSGMRERVRVAGGTLTVSAENGFTVVTVLPKNSAG